MPSRKTRRSQLDPCSSDTESSGLRLGQRARRAPRRAGEPRARAAAHVCVGVGGVRPPPRQRARPEPLPSVTGLTAGLYTSAPPTGSPICMRIGGGDKAARARGLPRRMGGARTSGHSPRLRNLHTTHFCERGGRAASTVLLAATSTTTARAARASCRARARARARRAPRLARRAHRAARAAPCGRVRAAPPAVPPRARLLAVRARVLERARLTVLARALLALLARARALPAPLLARCSRARPSSRRSRHSRACSSARFSRCPRAPLLAVLARARLLAAAPALLVRAVQSTASARTARARCEHRAPCEQSSAPRAQSPSYMPAPSSRSASSRTSRASRRSACLGTKFREHPPQ